MEAFVKELLFLQLSVSSAIGDWSERMEKDISERIVKYVINIPFSRPVALRDDFSGVAILSFNPWDKMLCELRDIRPCLRQLSLESLFWQSTKWDKGKMGKELQGGRMISQN